MSEANKTRVSKTPMSKTPVKDTSVKDTSVKDTSVEEEKREISRPTKIIAKPTVRPPERPLDPKVRLQRELALEKQKDHTIVKGQFRYYALENGTLEFSFKKYKGDRTKKYTMVDYEYYEIPLMVAKWLNKGGVIQEYEYKNGPDGKPIMAIGKKRHRVGFQHLGFSSEMEDSREYDSIVIASPFKNQLL